MNVESDTLHYKPTGYSKHPVTYCVFYTQLRVGKTLFVYVRLHA